MMKIKLYSSCLFFFLIWFLKTEKTYAQLFIDTSFTAEEMVIDFFDNSCVTPSNITFTGASESMAFFDAGNTSLGILAGILLSTGNAFSAIGPNSNGGTSGNTGASGDSDLENLIGGFSTFDAAFLEMDIVATGQQLDFSYIFASEEYEEFVGSAFNDVFAFFISGPGINGIQNIAMIPNSTDPVSINNVNQNSNSNFYVNNENGVDLSFDGLTTEMTASVTVTPGETYHVKIAVGDVVDAAFDSAVFLGIESLCGDSLLSPQSNAQLSSSGNTTTFDNHSKYATSWDWDFGDNNTSTDRHPAPHEYTADGFYTVTLISSNYCCKDTMVTEVTIGNPVSSEDLQEKPFLFFPNPVSEVAELNFLGNEDFELNIFDWTGKLIFYKKGNENQLLNFENYQPGIYLLEIKTKCGHFREKILKF